MVAVLSGVLGIGCAAPALAQMLPLPPGDVLSGLVYRRDGTWLPSVRTGADANTYIFSTPPTESFVSSAPAAVVRTTAETQYVRVYTEGTTRPVGGFIAGSDTVRGMTAAEIKDRLALPYLPDSLTIVRVPAGTCILTGTGAPILGNFPANPPSIPVGGPWGGGGTAQSLLIGTSDDPNCANPQFLPSDAYANRQLIGDKALAYAPRAGGGNAGAIAEALDRATPPQLFGDMDHVYNSLDLLNYGDDDPLRSALQQLSGEIYADLPSVEIAGAETFLNTLQQQMRRSRTGGTAAAGGPAIGGPGEPGSTSAWIAGLGSFGRLSGDGDTHDVDFDILGVAIGFDHRLDDALAVGGALSLSTSSFDTRTLSGDGNLTTFSLGLYASYSPAAWYVDGALGYAHGWGTVSRAISFPGIDRFAAADTDSNLFLSGIETGYRLALGDSTDLTPFAGFQAIVVGQDEIREGGAGAVNLEIGGRTVTSAQGMLGAELAHRLDIGLAAPLGLSLRAAWSHDVGDTDRSFDGRFEGSDAEFTVEGARAPRDLARIGVGVTLAAQAVNLFLRYDGSFADDYRSQAATGGLRVSF
ncbi:autotransporter domain-containing protein [Inquilinus sp. NPDC058860]|uniref:autotransporter outer membrane beta-barrel domain-containing protein n=1 Tax=Inquilinus sp. NPDC058860 TaxID=3346652 RepID=UPI00369B7950